MNSDFWLYYWQQNKFSNYTISFIVISQIIAIIFTLIYWRKETANKLILLYSCYGLLLFTVGFYLSYIKIATSNKIGINELSNILFATIELFTFTCILKNSIKNKFLKLTNRAIKFFYIGLIPILTYIILNDSIDNKTKRYVVDSISFFEIAYIGILVLNYFIDIFKSIPLMDLKNSPTFWISSFLLLYSIGFPLTILLTEHYRYANKEIFRILISLHYLSFSLVYVGITKALLCKKTLTS